MNLFKVPDKSSFITEVVNYVINNFGNDFSKLKVILPTGYLCSYLQESLTLLLETSVLPIIIPINELTFESEEAFKIPSSEINMVTKLEERIILAEATCAYERLNYNIIQSLRLSSQLAHLFHELETNEITVEQLENVPTVNQSKHWHLIYEFLVFANRNWQIKLKELGKLSRAKYQQVMFNAERARLKREPGVSLLIAGVTGNNIQTQKFIKEIAELPNGHLILPPTGNVDSAHQTSPEGALFNISKLLSLMGQKLPDFKSLGQGSKASINKLLGSEDTVQSESDLAINYAQFDNIFGEAAYIASLIESYILPENKTRIALVLNNVQTKEIYTNFLDKYSITYHDLIGIDILELNQISFILSIAEILYTDFSLKKLFNLLGNPIINHPIAIRLKNLLIKENPFAASLNEVLQTACATQDQELKDWTGEICGLLDLEQEGEFFHPLLLEVIAIAEKLCPPIWQMSAKFHLSEIVAEILNQNWHFKLESREIFPEVLKKVIEGGRIFPQITGDAKASLVLCRAKDAALINFDHVIMADFSEGSYPAEARSNPWMSRHMQDTLELKSELAIAGTALYEFYLLLNNPNVMITRSKKQISGKLLAESHLLLRLEAILKQKLNKLIVQTKELALAGISCQEYVMADFFPAKISATDVETLIRSPYNFYAKKILKLRHLGSIEDAPGLAEFGNFFHKVAEQYTKNYNQKEQDKALAFIQLGKFILEEASFPENSKKHWQAKIAALAEDFIDFDEKRRKKATLVFSEVRGSIKLDINGREIEIIAIADRIEITKEGKAIILDYKTGTIPTNKDILSGLSPQLIIEALIMLENGFGLGATETELLVYVKIGSAKPYIDITEISLSKADLLRHKAGLISLLEYYLAEKKFQIEPNMMRYDNYRHLSRCR